MRKILYVSGSRADYGLMKSILHRIQAHPQLELEIIATGMHLMHDFGESIKTIKKDGFKLHKLDCIYHKNDKQSMAIFIGQLIMKLTKKIDEINPDIILILGDRGEMLSTAIVGSYLGIPVAHVHGGDVSSTIDDLSRHAITKLSHIHFPATKKSAKRISNMGEESWRIHVVGTPSLDYILHTKKLTKKNIEEKIGFRLSKPLLILIQHPVSMEIDEAANQIKETLEAICEIEAQTIVIYPNSDAGSKKMIEVIEEYVYHENIHIFRNIEYETFISLLAYADAIVGNSSSALIEAPALGLGAVDIGTRQMGRECAENIIHTGYNQVEIMKAISTVLSPEFKMKLDNLNNPYGNGTCADRIIRVLSDIDLNEKLIQKRLTF